MGLIKTGLTLAGGYGLIKAASKAANDYHDGKAKRHSQNQPQSYPHQQYHPGQEQQMGYTYPNQMNNTFSQPQSRAVEHQMKHGEPTPPPYHQVSNFEMPHQTQHGSAQEYYSGKSK
ncbi:uncharacterized protein N7498_001156 [Penicillium cinerascens]|uniref:Uncharacterized protein n=1 Tax=Penicillium cinerascens TaxID=70096 RepID=A0A9W9NFM7_9EURO|nr:uncharacterized protein N7498_001156 [Penicillium cinerascens]KAJ5219057.1 hypothetical protein N7498_001156 [Penicillium cinerascens]